MERTFEGRMRVLAGPNEKLCKVQILALNDAVNRNGWRYINLKEHCAQFKDIPILTAYTEEGDGIGSGHNFETKTDDQGEEYASFTAADAERIIGWVPGSATAEIIQRNGVNWIQVTGALWRWYAREAVDKLTSHPEGMDVSIETLVTKEHKEPDGTEVEEEYTVLGITVLGNGTRPAVKGAGIRKLNALREAMKAAVQQAEEYQRTGGNTVEEKNCEAGQGVEEKSASKANSGVEALQRENADLRTRIAELEAVHAKWMECEKKHRCEAAVNAVKDELRELNEPREASERFDAKLCDALVERCQAGEFNSMENDEGEWNGAEAIRHEVRALCMQAQHEMDLKKTEQKNQDREPSPVSDRYMSWTFPTQTENKQMTVADRLRENGGN